MTCNQIKYVLLVFLSSNFVSANYTPLENVSPPLVTIPQGTLQGRKLKTICNRNIDAFLGIPYAEPPTRNLRFANPVAAKGWSGTRNASIDANTCCQYQKGIVTGNEDCLYLNVYTPQLPQSSSTSLRPVMVYIHGGGFSNWCSASTFFGPEYLLDEDVLLVTLNYRLGSLGFLSTGDEVASGNWGLKDQILALKWVQNNIKYFGGDPDQVTLFGQSAGSVAVHLLTLSDQTIGLFHRYITQSGSALAQWAVRPRIEYASLAFELGEYVGCFNATTHSLINCLQSATASDIIATDPQFRIWASYSSMIWGPIVEPDIEGAVLIDSPANMFAKGQIRDLPWICGVTRDEGLFFTADLYKNWTMFYELLENSDDFLPYVLNYLYQADGGAAWVKAIKSYYFNNDLTTDKSLLLANITMVVGDSHFAYPAYNALRQHHAIAKNPQYFYVFEYRGALSFTDDSTHSEDYGVDHSDDLIYLFPMPAVFASSNNIMSSTDHEMIDIMVKLWTSFAINGTPTTSSPNKVTTWNQYSTAGNYLRIGNGPDTTLEDPGIFVVLTYAENVDPTSFGGNFHMLISLCLLLLVFLFICSEYFSSAATVNTFGYKADC